MFIVIMILVGYVIYMIGLIRSYRNPSSDISPFPYIMVLVICAIIGLLGNLIAANHVNYEQVPVQTVNVLSFEQHTGIRGTFLFGIGSIREEIKYHITAEKNGKVIIYSLAPEEVQIYKTKDTKQRMEIYTANYSSPTLQKLFFLPVRTVYRLFLQEEFLQK